MGACYAAMEENGATACKDTLYLSDDMIQHNLGMWMEIPSVVITQEQIMSGQDITIKNLSAVADASYTDKSWMPSCDWMTAALGS